MSKSEFTSTISTTTISAAIVIKGEKKPQDKLFTVPGNYTEEEAENVLEKLGKKQGFRLAYVNEVKTDSALYAASIDDFTARAKKLEYRGQDGRTREPVITRTLETTTISAAIVIKGEKKPQDKLFTVPGNYTEEEAENVLEKLGKKQGFRLAYVNEVKTDSAVYEMKVSEFLGIAHKENTES